MTPEEPQVLVPTWVLMSAFRYALGRQTFVARDTIRLLHEHAEALNEAGYASVIADEIRMRLREENLLPFATDWEALAAWLVS